MEDPVHQPRPDDYVVMLAQVPERVGDIALSLDENRLRYRHGPAFPTLQELVAHMARSGQAVDALLRQVCIDGRREVDVGAAMDPPPGDVDADTSAAELMETLMRDRRRTVDLLRGLTEEQWAQPVEDRVRGELSLLEVCDAIGRHEAGHVTQLRNLIAVLPE
ncbi:MAG: DinB family protein, partial [Chloroflexi bacterium]